jgi:hypothetical protein
VAAVTTDAIERKADELSGADGRAEAVTELLTLVDGDRPALEAARNNVARRLHGNPSDWAATATLGLLNQALVQFGWTDAFDWKIRWGQRFRRP